MGATGAVANSSQQVAVGDAGGRKEDIVSGHQVLGLQYAVEVVAGVDRLLAFAVVDGRELGGIRVGTLQDSRLTAKRLCSNRRVVCAAPDYLQRHGVPVEPKDLHRHNCIVLRENEGDYALWRFGADNDESAIRVGGNLSSNDGDVITRWCVEGHGLIMRSIWHVGPLIRDGRLTQVFADIPTPSADIHALNLATAHAPRRIRALVDHLATGLRARVET